MSADPLPSPMVILDGGQAARRPAATAEIVRPTPLRPGQVKKAGSIEPQAPPDVLEGGFVGHRRSMTDPRQLPPERRRPALPVGGPTRLRPERQSAGRLQETDDQRGGGGYVTSVHIGRKDPAAAEPGFRILTTPDEEDAWRRASEENRRRAHRKDGMRGGHLHSRTSTEQHRNGRREYAEEEEDEEDEDSSSSENEARQSKRGPARVDPAIVKDSLKREEDDQHAGAVTSSADEFVWIDSHNRYALKSWSMLTTHTLIRLLSRLVELQKLPWTTPDLTCVIKRAMEDAGGDGERLALDVAPRLSTFLQRTLVRVAREAQRLARPLGRCGGDEVATALRIILPPSLAAPAFRACLRSATRCKLAGEDISLTKSERAGLALNVGKMHQWMCQVKVGNFVADMAAVYMAAAVESVLEEVIGFCVAVEPASVGSLNSGLLEQVRHLLSG